MELEALADLVRSEVDDKVSIRARRPGLYQIDVPAFMADGDGASIFIENAASGRIRVSDLGQTRMRASYARKLDRDVDRKLEQLARSQGFRLDAGTILVDVPTNEFLPAVLGLVQIEAQADEAIRAPTPRAARADEFRAMVQRVLRQAFDERCEIDYVVDSVDSERRFVVDAFVRMSGRPMGILVAPNDLEAERAIGTKLKLAPELSSTRWIAVPRDITRLAEKTQKRLMSEFLAPVPEFDESRALELASKIDDLAA